MKAVIQRVSSANVRVDGAIVGEIGAGCLVLLGVIAGDTLDDAERLAERTARYRIFEDEAGKMNCSALQLGRAVLVVSQFTLAADGCRGRRPSFDAAERPDRAEPLVTAFCRALEALGLEVRTGVFGAAMEVALVNAGPATFLLDEPKVR